MHPVLLLFLHVQETAVHGLPMHHHAALCVAVNKYESVLSIVELVMFRHLLEYWNGWLEYRCPSVYEMGLVPLPLAKGSHVPCVEHISRLTPFTLTLLYMYMLG